MERLHAVKFNEEGKKLKLRWDRVFIAIGILFCVLYTTIHLTGSIIKSIPTWIDEKDAEFVENVLINYDTTPITLHSGETVWEKQQELIPSSEYNMFDILYVLKQINGGFDDWHNVRTGDSFLMLTEKTNNTSEKVASN